MRLLIARALMETGFAWLLRRWRPRAVGWWLTRAGRDLAMCPLKGHF
jgi:hypothetical protein